MKTYLQVQKEIEKLTVKIKAVEKTIEDLQLMDQRRAAAAAGDREKHAELIQAFKENETKISELCNAVYLDKVTNAFLTDNAKVALYNDCKKAITEVLTKYNGKPYGDKTREKIRTELKEKTGCYIWISAREINISYHGENKNGYYIELCKVRLTTNYNTPVITADNKINAAALETINTYEKYTENPTKAAKNLIKKREKAYKALQAAIELLSDYGHETPTKVKDNCYICNPLYHTMQGI